MILKLNQFGEVIQDGFYGERRAGLGFEDNVALGEYDKGAASIRDAALKKFKARKQKALKARKQKIQKQIAQNRAKRLKEQNYLKHLQKKRAERAKVKADIYMQALKESQDFAMNGVTGDPFEGFESAGRFLNPSEMKWAAINGVGYDEGFGFKLSLPKIKVKVPTLKEVGQAASKIHRATNVGAITQKIVSQVGGHKLTNALNKTTGGLYSSAINVFDLPAKVLAQEKITAQDVADVIKVASAMAAVYGAGTLTGFVAQQLKQRAAQELAKTGIGGSAGAVVAGAASLATGAPPTQVAREVAVSESKRVATKEAAKKLGKDSKILVAGAEGLIVGGPSGLVVGAKEATKDRATEEFEAKTGLPIGLAKQAASGKVPAASDVSKSMQAELTKAPEKLKAELEKIPEQIKKAPAHLKQALIQKQTLLKNELRLRDGILVRLIREEAEALKKNAAEYSLLAKELTVKTAKLKSLQAKLPMLNGKAKSDLQNEIVVLEKEIAAINLKLTGLTAQKATIKQESAAKQLSTSNGFYGIRITDQNKVIGVGYHHPLLMYLNKGK